MGCAWPTAADDLSDGGPSPFQLQRLRPDHHRA
nr:hypothetical protein [Pseudomonas reinekei]